MAFDAEEMSFPTFCPDPALLASLTAGSGMITPQKIKRVMGELVFPAPPPDRPYLYGCMVLSFDGKMGFFDNPEGTLISKENRYDHVGGKTDFWLMNVCRTYSDAVIFGTGTLKARMNKLWYAEISDPELVEARTELGKSAPNPLSIIASIDGRDVPLEHPIFSRKEKPILITSLSGAEYLKRTMMQDSRIVTAPCDLAAGCETIQLLAAGLEKPDTGALMTLLRHSGVSYISVEAPSYIWVLLREGILDEYMLNYSGVMAGGPNTVGNWGGYSAEHHPHAALLSLGYHKGFLYTRQKMIYQS